MSNAHRILETVYPSDRMSQTEFAGHAAADVEANWHKPEYRNLVHLALGTYIEDMIVAHQDEWRDLVKKALKQTSDKARRSVVKAYLAEQISKTVTDDHGHVHDESGKFTGPGGNHAHVRSGGRARAHALDDHFGKPLDLAQAARLGNTINAFAHYSTEGIQNQQMKFVVEDKKGNQRVFVSHDGKLPDMAKDEKVVSYKPLGLPQTETVGGHSFNLLQMLGAPTQAAAAGGGAATAIQSMAKSEGNHYEKVRAASQLLTQLGAAGVVPPPVAAAGMVGLYAAKHGPEVVEVLGPHMRKFSYKYRGMEALPQQRSSVATRGKGVGAGVAPDESTEAYEFRLAGALASRDKAKGGLGAVAGRKENALLLATGGTAPSHGFILNRDGEVTQQVVGVADDHYVPFNLKKLHDLDGGSYVRSRAFGGPTTEDMALALRTGAKRLTTVSRHGVYTVEFETRANSIRGRYGDVPPLVINRYGRLLDGIKHGNLQGPDSQTLKLNGEGYNVALNALRAQFPLLIKSVKYHKAADVPGLKNGESEATAQEDTGYVRPFYLKPGAAKSGYYDPRLGAAPKSYDTLKSHRMAKANRYLAAAKAAHQASLEEEEAARTPAVTGNGQRDSNQGDAKDGRSMAPNNLTGRAAQVAEADGGTSSSPRLEEMDRKPNPVYAASLLSWAKTIVDGHDGPEAEHLARLFAADQERANGSTNVSRANLDEFDALENNLVSSAVARDNFVGHVADMWDSHPVKGGLTMPQIPEGDDSGDEASADPDAPDVLVGNTDRKDHDKLKFYLGMKKTLEAQQKALAEGKPITPPGEDKMKRFKELHDYFNGTMDEELSDENGQPRSLLYKWNVHEFPEHGGLTYKEHIENQLADEVREPRPHKVKYTPKTLVPSVDDDEETKKHIGENYADDFLRELEAGPSEYDMFGDDEHSGHGDFFG